MTRRSDRIPEELPELPIPDPVQFLNYAGDQRGNVGRVMGPMLDTGTEFRGQLLTVVTEEYDKLTDRTRLGLTYGDLSAQIQAGAA